MLRVEECGGSNLKRTACVAECLVQAGHHASACGSLCWVLTMNPHGAVIAMVINYSTGWAQAAKDPAQGRPPAAHEPGLHGRMEAVM